MYGQAESGDFEKGHAVCFLMRHIEIFPHDGPSVALAQFFTNNELQT
jgi:hypothetical protein